MADFFSTEAGEFAGLAKQFLEGAKVLSDAQSEKGRILFRPTLMLAGQGLEAMLKACLCLNGQVPPKAGPAGHNCLEMWSRDVCKPLQWHVVCNAMKAAASARAAAVYPDVPNDDEAVSMINTYVVDLCGLHGDRGYVLRYPAAADTQAPRTPFLVDSLWRTADYILRFHNDFTTHGFEAMIRIHGAAMMAK